MNSWLLLQGGALLLVGLASAMVSAAESALLAFDTDVRRSLRKKHPSALKEIEPLLANKKHTQSALFLWDSILNLALIGIAVAIWLKLVPGATPESWDGRLPPWLPLACGFVVLFLCCEMIPKLIAFRRPERVLSFASALLPHLVAFASPLVVALTKCLIPLQGWAAPGKKNAMESAATRRAELMALLEIAAEEGVIFPEEAGMMREIIRLGGETVSHCMTPRVDAFLLPDDLDNQEVAMLIRTRRHRRVPVHGETPDDVLGVLDVERFLRDPHTHYMLQLDSPGFVPESMKALELLQNFLLGRRKLALLLDEYGGFEGIVTLSDIIEELVGEQGPHAGSVLYLEKVSPQQVIAGGHARLDDLHDALGIDFSDSHAGTLGGFLMESTGGVPLPGTSFVHEGWIFEVRRSSRKRIKEVIVHRAETGGMVPP